MLISSLRHAAHVWVFFPLLARFFSNSSQDSWLAIIYYGATKPISKEVTWFFLLYRDQTSLTSKSVISKSETFAYNKITNGGEKITAFAQMLKERSHSTESTKKQKRSEIVFLHKRSYDKVSIA